MCEIYGNQNNEQCQQPLLSSFPPSLFCSSSFCFFFPPSAPVPTPCHLCPCVGDSHPCNMGPHVCRWPCCWVACQEEWWPLFNSAASDEVGVRPLGPRPLRVPEAISSLPKVITPRVGGRMFPFPGHNSWGCLLNVFDLEIVSS